MLPQATGQVITAIEFRGTRRVPADSLRATILTKVGDFYSQETLRRDFMKLYNGGRFDDLRLETEEDGKGGILIRFIVQERRVVSTINYEGIHSVTVSEILDRFKERKVSLTVDSPFDPNKIQHAAVVIKEYISERGHQYATVEPQLEQVPPSSLKLTFMVNEGPKVKVGAITITGNRNEKSRWVIAGMKELKPYGIPHSIIFENLFARTYDQNKLEYDEEKIRMKYSDNGYFRAKVLEPAVSILPRGGKGWRLPLIKMNRPGIYADITIPVEEGRLYHLHAVNFVGVKAFKEPDTVLLPLFGMRLGDTFSTEKLRKGLENLRNLYGQFGYYDFVPEPDFGFDNGPDQVDLTINTEEGKQFFVRRIDFSGNTTTRDKVIRREIMLDEGDIFNTNLWDLQHPAPQPARLLRDAEEGRRRRYQAQPQFRYRGYHSQGEGARQELRRPQRRRVGDRRQFRGLQLFHQQLPGTGRNSLAHLATRHPPAQRVVGIHGTVPVRPPHPDRISGLPEPVRL